MLLHSRAQATANEDTVLHWLAHWAATTPDTAFMTTLDGTERQELTYRQAWTDAQRVGSALRAAGLERGDRVMVAAPNSFDHLSMGYGAMLAGLIYVPVAPRYLADAGPGGKLATILDLLTPKLAFVADSRATEAVSGRVRVVAGAPGLARLMELATSTLPAPGDIDPEAPTKILLTSGSTGTPKPVAYSQHMMTANTQMTIDVWPFIAMHRPVLVDWLPWNHAFGGNANINLILSQGGTLHIDEGGGTPDGVSRTVANLKRFRPTFHGAVPAGFAALVQIIETEPDFRHAFFDRLDVMFTAGASMHPSIFERLNRASESVRGEAVPIVNGWGATEVGPGATMVHQRDAPPGCIGTPLPGVEIKMRPTGQKYELLVRSRCVAPGYWRMPAETDLAFDPDGFYRSGDAGALIDPQHPELGLRFDGRIAEDFKLANGTWVDANRLRTNLLRASDGGLRDLVILGPDRPFLTLLAWPADAHAFTQNELDRLISAHNHTFCGQSRSIVSGELLEPAPSPQEVSPKGQLIRIAVINQRAEAIERMYEKLAKSVNA